MFALEMLKLYAFICTSIRFTWRMAQRVIMWKSTLICDTLWNVNFRLYAEKLKSLSKTIVELWWLLELTSIHSRDKSVVWDCTENFVFWQENCENWETNEQQLKKRYIYRRYRRSETTVVLMGAPGFAMLADSNASQATSSNETDSTVTLMESLAPVYFTSGTFIAVLSIVAMFANGFLLLAIWKDPYRTFRVPPTVFVTGLAVADFLTGFLVGPIIAYVRIAPPSERSTYRLTALRDAGKTMSFLTMNASYLVLLFLTWNQFAAIRFPHQHRRFITTRKVTACVVGIWCYAISFSLLPFCGINPEIINKLDFYMHTVFFMFLLVIAYLCLFVAFQNQVQRITLATTQHSVRGTNHNVRRRYGLTRNRKRSERQFSTLTLVLVLFIIICTLPSLILQFLSIYWSPTSFEEKLSILIALEVCSDVLFLKFALDPFIYCWRLTSYRKALKSLLFLGRVSVARENRFSFINSVQMRGAMANGVISVVSGRRESYMMSIRQGSGVLNKRTVHNGVLMCAHQEIWATKRRRS